MTKTLIILCLSTALSTSIAPPSFSQDVNTNIHNTADEHRTNGRVIVGDSARVRRLEKQVKNLTEKIDLLSAKIRNYESGCERYGTRFDPLNHNSDRNGCVGKDIYPIKYPEIATRLAADELHVLRVDTSIGPTTQEVDLDSLDSLGLATHLKIDTLCNASATTSTVRTQLEIVKTDSSSEFFDLCFAGDADSVRVSQILRLQSNYRIIRAIAQNGGAGISQGVRGVATVSVRGQAGNTIISQTPK